MGRWRIVQTSLVPTHPNCLTVAAREGGGQPVNPRPGETSGAQGSVVHAKALQAVLGDATSCLPK